MAIQLFTQQDENEIINAIKAAEKNTSGEIRVHLESKCKGPAFERAKEVFEKLEMHQTEQKNGVLFYIALEDHLFYILGDQGINDRVEANFWESTKELVIEYFKKAEFKQGLIAGILKAGEQLQNYFPYQADDVNELSDEISKGK
ncbi:TPM domain-containing protein [Mesonia sp. HuA40]|uniref:TPM domain-containing protein n=1 Tax=Mesonia sp. HuA40 TaxID=2602761 RepID=UPI0011C94CD6|nr:TPM domain-containing protein [Mesonia sp. HuA40]TXK73234.1 TPM domain-containing protein [Mesonia sp. HuA40]